MQGQPQNQIQAALTLRHRRRAWLRAATALMVVVVFCTTYALILPAITESHRTYCGQAEHAHTEACYQLQDVAQVALTCDPVAEFAQTTGYASATDDDSGAAQEAGAGAAADAGVSALQDTQSGEGAATDAAGSAAVAGGSAGGAVDVILHAHNQYCYDAAGQLICGLEERAAHTHTDACYATDPTTGQLTESLTCTLPEVAVHVHTAACYAPGTQVISCGLPQVIEHNHTAACQAQTGATLELRELTCGQAEHEHSDAAGCFTAPETLTYTFEDETISAQVTIPFSDQYPEDLTCTVTPITQDNANYQAMYDAVCQTLPPNQALEQTVLYHLNWASAGAEYALPEGVQTTVDVDYKLAVDNETQLNYVALNESASTQTNAAASGEGSLADADARTAAGVGTAVDISTEDVTVELDTPSSGQSQTSAPAAMQLLNKSSYDAQISLLSTDGTTTITDDTTPLNDGATIATDANDVTGITDIVSTSYSATSTTSDEIVTDGTDFGITLMSLNVASSAGYYERVDSTTALKSLATSGNQFVIIFAENNAMLGSSSSSSSSYRITSDTYASSYGNAPSWSNQSVVVQPVRGSDGNQYFVLNNGSSYLSPSSASSYHWQFSAYSSSQGANNYGLPTSDFYRIKNKSTNEYLWTGYSCSYYSSSSYSTNYYGYSTAMQLDHVGSMYSTSEWPTSYNVWRMWSREYTSTYSSSYGYYVGSTSSAVVNALEYNTSTKKITQTQATSKSSYYSSYAGNSNADIIILRYVSGVTQVDDEAAVKDIQSESVVDVKSETKPAVVTDASSITSSKTSTTNVTDATSLLGAQVTATSDAASSTIESTLRENLLTDTPGSNDGRVVSDKSVVYQKDDYGAFDTSSYGTGDFSVTLSTLGQEWTTSDSSNTETPIDVVFILDMSSSMYNSPSYTSPRWQASVDAINSITQDIMKRNENNRVGLAVYSNVAYTALELNHYDLTKSSNKILQYDASDTSTTNSSGTVLPGIGTLKTADNLTAQIYDTSTATTKLTEVEQFNLSYGVHNGLWGLTYTQRGIQEAYNIFTKGATDKQVEVKTNDAQGNVITKTVTRQPVIILLSDGEPTLGTYNYMDPDAGPRYGDGAGFTDFGYGTVLSANYFKNMTSITYNKKASFYTIGLGLSESSNAYGCAVLDPSDERIKGSSSSSMYYYYRNYSSTNNYAHFYRLLENIDSSPVTTGTLYYTDSISYDAVYGYTHRYLTAAINPYENYDYSDKAFFGEMTSSELIANLKEILDEIQYYNNYGFLLESGTSLDMTDQIGSGMEVKGSPVLRYNAQNYTATSSSAGTDASGKYTQYVYDYSVTLDDNTAKKGDEQTKALKEVTVKVYDAVYDSAGALQTPQKVLFSIPEYLVPVFYPNLYKQFYFEELPIRLIFKVGLTEESLAAVASASGDYTGTFYTNVDNTSGGASGYKVAATTVTFEPKVGESDDTDNTYYKHLTSGGTYNLAEKTASTSSDTYAYSFAEIPTITADSSGKDTSIAVTQYLGNNGKLEISKPEGLTMVLKKEWPEGAGNVSSVNVNVYAHGTRAYSSGSYTGTAYEGTWKIGTVTLSESNGWQATFTRAKEYTESYYKYVYDAFYIAEDTSSMSNIVPSYRQGTGDSLVQLQTVDDGIVLSDGSTVGSAVAVTGGTVTVVNAKSYSLPNSGGVGEGVLVAAGCAVVAFATLGLLAATRRRKQTW